MRCEDGCCNICRLTRMENCCECLEPYDYESKPPVEASIEFETDDDGSEENLDS